MKTYIHYGQDAFVLELVQLVKSNIPSKPNRGLWGSPINSNWGWKNWCDSEDWYMHDMSKSFMFTLKPEAKILEIHHEEDILPYIHFCSYVHFRMCKTDICDELNLDKLYAEFDGIELFISENYEALHYSIFNTWDCDSICVWNPEMIIPC